MSATMSVPQLAQVLFTSSLQPSDRPSPTQVRAAVNELLWCSADCAAHVAQEAGDHPEAYAIRMRWALATVTAVFEPTGRTLVAA